jgi:copper chaperone CopZ
MNIFQEGILRLYLKPTVESDLPGRLRIRFRKADLLPKEALPYLHYVYDVLTLLDGVTDATVNPRIGTILITYDKNQTDAKKILHWVDTVVDTGITLVKEDTWQGASEETIARMMRERLEMRLGKTKEG